MYPNKFHDSNFKITLSNMPGLIDKGDISVMKYYDSYVKDITLPGYSLSTEDSVYKGVVTKQVLSGRDTGLDSFTISFKLSEDTLNYFFVLRWMMMHRYGVNENPMSDRIVDQKINKLLVDFYSNQKVRVAQYSFNKVICVNLSNLSLAYGSTDEVLFTCTFEYDNMDFEIFEKG